MGPLTIPVSGATYVDANVLIYTVEKHPRYAGLLHPLWMAVDAGDAHVLSSELAVLETLVPTARRCAISWTRSNAALTRTGPASRPAT